MRVISGSLGGREFKSPAGHKTHPMSEKVRGAIFNVLGDITGLSVLDAFAGSGALGFEAISRGAKNVTSIDNDNNAYKVMQENVQKLNIAKTIKVTKANINSWLDNNKNALFDIVLCDPPYDKIKPTQLENIAALAKKGGVIVFSLPPNAEFSLKSNYQLLTTKSYGDATLAFYKKTG